MSELNTRTTQLGRIVHVQTYALYDLERGAIRGTYDIRADAVSERGPNERVIKLDGVVVVPKRYA